MDLSIFLKLIDRFISLFNERAKYKNDIYEKFVAELHQEFEQLAAQYFAFYYHALLCKHEDTVTVIRELKQKRKDYLQSRVKLTSSLDALLESRLPDLAPDLNTYLLSAINFFHPSDSEREEMAKKTKANKVAKKRKRKPLLVEAYTQLATFDRKPGEGSRGASIVQNIEYAMHHDQDIIALADEIEAELNILMKKYQSICKLHMKLKIEMAVAKAY